MKRSILTVLISLAAIGSEADQRLAEGTFSLNMQTSSFEGPLFATDYSSTMNLFASQIFRSGERLSLFGSLTHPASHTDLTLELSGIEYLSGEGRVTVGDVGTRTLLPLRLSTGGLSEGSLRLRGVAGSWKGQGRQLQLTLGQERFRIALPSQTSTVRSNVLKADWLEQIGRAHFAGGLTMVRNPLYLREARRGDELASMLEGKYIREFRPYVHAFGSVTTDLEGNLAGKIGAGGRFQNGELSTHIFSFDDSLPLLYPLIRPGESGVQVDGTYHLSELSRLSGGVTWLEHSPLSDGSSLRTNASYIRGFGENRPTLAFRFNHNDLIYELAGDEQVARFGNQYTLEARKRSRSDSYAIVLQHNEDDRGVRSQLLGSRGWLLDEASRVETFAVMQRDDRGDYGLVSEATIDREWRAGWSYSVGLGVTYLAGEEDRADGVAILGIAKRNAVNDWYGWVDLTIPFDIGLPSADRISQRIRAGVGTSYEWRDVSQLRRLVSPMFDRNSFGSIEGFVTTAEGTPVGGAAVVVNGVFVARSGKDGRFVASSVAVGEATVTVDPLSIDPSLVLGTHSVRRVLVEPRSPSSVEIVLHRAVAFFGSVVRCDDAGGIVPLAKLELALVSDEGAYVVTTSATGSFGLDGIKPGTYRLVINPDEALPEELIPELRIDLTADVLGHVIRLGCN